MSDDSDESPRPEPTKKPVDQSLVFTKPVDLSVLFPKPVDLSALFPKPVDLSLVFTKPVDLSVLFPKPVDLSALFPWLDPSLLFPRIGLSSLAEIDAFVLSRVAGEDAGYGVDTGSSPAILSQEAIRRGLNEREVAATLTTFIFLIVWIGLSLAVKDYSKIAMLSRISGASPFDVAMGLGALTFWSSYSRRSS